MPGISPHPAAAAERPHRGWASGRRYGRHLQLLAFSGGTILFLFVVLLNAWVVDDAYITFRTVDNFVNGYGLRWNAAERVQAFTHPLWMLAVSAVYAVTSDLFFSSIALSAAFSVAAVLIAVRGFGPGSWRAPLLVLALLASKAVVDYSTSGLELPLAYTIAAIYVWKLLSAADVEAKLTWTVLCASLSFVTRPDSVVLYLPAATYLLWKCRGGAGRPRRLFLAALPAIAWMSFSLIYYGFPLPNTAYAKSLGTDFPASWVWRRGLDYVLNSAQWDSASHLMLVAATVAVIRKRLACAGAVLAGVWLYVLSVVGGLAAATHMSGRHLALPFFAAIVIFVGSVDRMRLTSVALIAYLIWSPVSPFKFGTRFYRPYPQHESYLDTKWWVHVEGASLLAWRPGVPVPNHRWFYGHGERLRTSPESVFLGVSGHAPVGYAGFRAGPGKFIVDVVGLTDPLLARLPAERPATYDAWQSGHFFRRVPAGYLESIQYDGNLIEDERLRKYYDVIRLITRRPLFSWRRSRAILAINLGLYDHLLHAEYSTADGNSGS